MATASRNGEDESPHVLAVDDNLVDRKLVEKLLRNSSCRGKFIAMFCLPWSLVAEFMI